MTKEYIPSPENTSDINLPEELSSLIEAMAKNVHEVWAKNRIAEGWTYGEKRDDENKKHPCLIPYEMLPDIEKEYDRATSQETLKLIIKSGFEIKKK
ncbi:MAG: Ryanodine receptor Ryr [Muribaculaceae bacterium]|nr:Ryanodine receptor Ryr [Muribaculaceae bacterium]